MPINHKYQIIFIHIPKIAGTSIEVFFNMQKKELFYGDFYQYNNGFSTASQHLTPLALKEKISPDTFNNYFKFTFVRNPYDRIISEYYYKRINNQNLISYNDFTYWLNNFLHKIDSDHKLPQYKYVYDHTNNTDKLINFIGKYENLSHDFNKILKLINYREDNLKLGKHYDSNNFLNVPKLNKDKLLTKENRDKIIDTYKLDFELFSYST